MESSKKHVSASVDGNGFTVCAQSISTRARQIASAGFADMRRKHEADALCLWLCEHGQTITREDCEDAIRYLETVRREFNAITQDALIGEALKK